jgi:hypothetical protein
VNYESGLEGKLHWSPEQLSMSLGEQPGPTVPK